MTTNRDWPVVKEEYIQGNLSVRELATKVGLPQSSVERHCTKEGWIEARRQYREQVAREVEALGAKKEAEKRLDILDSVYNIAGTLKETIDKIAQRVSSEGFKSDVGLMQANSLLERLSSLSTSFEKLARAISLLEGGPDHRVSVVTLADILGASASAR